MLGHIHKILLLCYSALIWENTFMCLLCLEYADAHFVHQFPPSREQEAEKLEDVRDTHCKHSFGILY